jgi:hypothetical protein
MCGPSPVRRTAPGRLVRPGLTTHIAGRTAGANGLRRRRSKRAAAASAQVASRDRAGRIRVTAERLKDLATAGLRTVPAIAEELSHQFVQRGVTALPDPSRPDRPPRRRHLRLARPLARDIPRPDGHNPRDGRITYGPEDTFDTVATGAAACFLPNPMIPTVNSTKLAFVTVTDLAPVDNRDRMVIPTRPPRRPRGVHRAVRQLVDTTRCRAASGRGQP